LVPRGKARRRTRNLRSWQYRSIGCGVPRTGARGGRRLAEHFPRNGRAARNLERCLLLGRSQLSEDCPAFGTRRDVEAAGGRAPVLAFVALLLSYVRRIRRVFYLPSGSAERPIRPYAGRRRVSSSWLCRLGNIGAATRWLARRSHRRRSCSSRGVSGDRAV